MPVSEQHHLSAQQLEQFVQGQLSPAEVPEIEAHLEACPTCCAALPQHDTLPDPFVARLRSAYLEQRPETRDKLGQNDTCGPNAGPDPYSTILGSSGKDTAQVRHEVLPSTIRGTGDAGQVFGEYDQLELIAQGGMGVVYKARQRSLNRVVALKMIRADMLGTAESVRRFYQEAKAAASLDHPNIVPIFSIAEHDNHHYYTMAYVAGSRLTAKVTPGHPLAPGAAVEILLPVVDAVEYAHTRGIIHRDLKPDNILVDGQGRPRVTDFGLAKQIQGEANLTATGAVLGTPSYMAPEQALGNLKQTGPATDIYALGGILYFLLTGRPPFTGSTATQVLSRLLSEPPEPPHTVNPAIPRVLSDICARCLAKQPVERYASAAELRQALLGFLNNANGAPPVVPVAATPQTGRSIALVAGAAAVMLTLGAGWLMWPTFFPGSDIGRKADEIKAPIVIARAAVFPELVHKDFPLTIEMLGSRAGQDGLQEITEGERISFRIATGRDAYVGVWSTGADGDITELFPNEHEPAVLFKAGMPRVLPGEAVKDYWIQAVPSKGVDRVRVIATTKPWKSVPGKKQGPYRVFHDLETQKQFATHFRGLVLKTATASEDAIAEAELLFRVAPKK